MCNGGKITPYSIILAENGGGGGGSNSEQGVTARQYGTIITAIVFNQHHPWRKLQTTST